MSDDFLLRAMSSAAGRAGLTFKNQSVVDVTSSRPYVVFQAHHEQSLQAYQVVGGKILDLDIGTRPNIDVDDAVVSLSRGFSVSLSANALQMQDKFWRALLAELHLHIPAQPQTD